MFQLYMNLVMFELGSERCNAALPATPNHPLNQKWPTGSGKSLNLKLFDHPINFLYISFLIDHSFYENLKNSKWPSLGPKKADGVWKGVLLSINKFLDPSTSF